MSSNLETVRLPDILTHFPWHRNVSDHHLEAKAESSAWFQRFHIFDKSCQRRVELCDFGLLAALAFVPREKELIRLGCDLIHILYAIDEHTDVTDADGALAIQKMVVDVLHNPYQPRPDGELTVGALVQDFWLRVISYDKPNAPCIEHFMRYMDHYTGSLVQEVADRTQCVYRNLEEYCVMRRDTSASYTCFALCELRLDLPEEVYHHPRMEKLREQAADMIGFINDINSYTMERSRGLEVHNAVEVVMKEQDTNLQGAMNWLARYAKGVHDSFLENVASMPSWGDEVDTRVKIFIDSLGQWIRATDDWSFETGRYFGSKGLEVKKSRVTTLLPPSTGFVKKSA